VHSLVHDLGHLRAEHATLRRPPAALLRIKIVDAEDRNLSWDGESVGTTCLRAPFIASEYLNIAVSSEHPTSDGCFR
jgi:hypothetical protein